MSHYNVLIIHLCFALSSIFFPSMDEKHINLINEHLEELIEETRDVHKIVDQLLREGVLNHYMADIILKNYLDDKRRAKELYSLIQGRGPQAFVKLTIALRGTENLRAEEILRGSSKVTYYSSLTSNFKSIKIHPKIYDVQDTIQSTEPEDIVVKVHPEGKFMDIDEQNKPLGTFKMRSKPRGLALIINIYNTESHDPRPGSEKDVKKLEKLFENIGYKVTLYKDLKRQEMKEKIIAFSQNPELEKVDSCIVFIMSHGRVRRDTEISEIIASDGQPLATQWITEQFTASNCRLVTKEHPRKPKMFFFQCCRKVPNEPDKANIANPRIQSDSVATLQPSHSGNRDVEDMIIVYSTLNGYYSMREPTTGTWFVNSLVRVIAEHAWEHDLETMLGLVDEKLRTKFHDQYGPQTMEIKRFGGIGKKIYFNPGL